MIELIKRDKDIAEVNTMAPLTWAYIGDGVYDLFIRTHLINTTRLKPHMLHIEAIKYVKADAQVKTLNKIYVEQEYNKRKFVCDLCDRCFRSLEKGIKGKGGTKD